MRILLVEPAYRRVSLEKTLAPGDGLEVERKVSCPVQNETFKASVRLTTSASGGPCGAATSHS